MNSKYRVSTVKPSQRLNHGNSYTIPLSDSNNIIIIINVMGDSPGQQTLTLEITERNPGQGMCIIFQSSSAHLQLSLLSPYSTLCSPCLCTYHSSKSPPPTANRQPINPIQPPQSMHSKEERHPSQFHNTHPMPPSIIHLSKTLRNITASNGKRKLL